MQLPFDALKFVLMEEDFESNVTEWNKKAKNKKWYQVTSNAFVNYLYEVTRVRSSIARCECSKGMKLYFILIFYTVIERDWGCTKERHP